MQELSTLRVIPSIDLMSGKVVRLRRGDPNDITVYSDDPLQFAARWEQLGADAIHVVDLDATLTRGNNLGIISEISRKVSIPVQVGGGIRSFEYARNVLKSGVSRIVIGTLAFTDLNSLEKIIDQFGATKIILSLDYQNDQVMINGWRSATGTGLLSSLHNFESKGIRAFLLTAIQRDGMLEGPDLDTLDRVRHHTKGEIQASGGFRSINDILMVQKSNVDSIILGRALYEGHLKLENVMMLVKEKRESNVDAK
ncbi:MAG: 1-(5-phosphoribosyl)-5-[(5-phosphoribosylamino)methylideneamino]imidazole-4-carboxamide isomerase [Nitrososphaerales archaeon]